MTSTPNPIQMYDEHILNGKIKILSNENLEKLNRENHSEWHVEKTDACFIADADWPIMENTLPPPSLMPRDILKDTTATRDNFRTSLTDEIHALIPVTGIRSPPHELLQTFGIY